MKSSSNQYFIGLDHIRALAAYLVFCWHFLHWTRGSPIPFSYDAKVAFLSLINEGHIGVSFFMVLSGYLFAKILNNKQINYSMFYLNRFLRLAPLMIFVVFINATINYDSIQPALRYFFGSLVNGLVFPYLPNAGWSITVEFHFYLLLPFLLWFGRDSVIKLLAIIALMIAARFAVYFQTGSVQYLSYWTIIGRIDLFIIGIIGYRYSKTIQTSKVIFWLSLLSLAVFYWLFDHAGGERGTTNSIIWAFFSTMEGGCLVGIIVGYEHRAKNWQTRTSKALANIGRYSYSMYLLHIFLVAQMATFIHTQVIDLSNFYLAWFAASVSFLALVPIAFVSYKLVEEPFLTFRVNYLIGKES